jgi:hypothetical protein
LECEEQRGIMINDHLATSKFQAAAPSAFGF